jgi:histidyl-tRNA synthetase
MERLLMALGVADTPPEEEANGDVYVIPLGDVAMAAGFKLLGEIRASGISAEMDYMEGSLKASLRRADSRKAKVAIVIGDNELNRGVVQMKNMVQGGQEEVPLAEVVGRLSGK